MIGRWSNALAPWRLTAISVAVVAAAFCAAAAAVAAANYLRTDEPTLLEPPQIRQLQQRLTGEPGNQQLKDDIRRLDLAVRKTFFLRQALLKRAGWLLLGGAAVMLCSLHLARMARPRMPSPAGMPARPGQLLTAAARARRAVWLAALLAAGGAGGLGSLRGLTPSYELPAPATAAASPAELHWPRFRGPAGAGIAPPADYVKTFDGASGQNILWKSPVEMPGQNSPIVIGRRVFLSGADERRRVVCCFDADTGKLLWQREVAGVKGSPPAAPEVTEETGHAAPTMAGDGLRVFAVFSNLDIVCFDHDGRQLWARNFGPIENMYGYASSLEVFDGRVLLLLDTGFDNESGSELLALDAATGKLLWDVDRDVPNSWASPLVATVAGRSQLITAACPWVISYDPADGKELWRADCLGGDVAPSPVCDDNAVYAVNAMARLAAIRADGSGDVSGSHLAWSSDEGLPDICSPLLHGRRLYLLTTEGTLSCFDAADGKMLYQQTLNSSFRCSPSLLGEQLLLIADNGEAFFLAGGQQFRQTSSASLGEPCDASPAFAFGRIYVRGKQNLYCIGAQ